MSTPGLGYSAAAEGEAPRRLARCLRLFQVLSVGIDTVL